MENKKCPECGSENLMSGDLSASFGLTFIPDTEKGIAKKSSFVTCLACKECGAVFGLKLKDEPSKLTNR